MGCCCCCGGTVCEFKEVWDGGVACGCAAGVLMPGSAATGAAAGGASDGDGAGLASTRMSGLASALGSGLASTLASAGGGDFVSPLASAEAADLLALGFDVPFALAGGADASDFEISVLGDSAGGAASAALGAASGLVAVSDGLGASVSEGCAPTDCGFSRSFAKVPSLLDRWWPR